MSDKPNDGGPAFPPHAQSTAEAYMGMTLRDYFAAHASEADIAAHRSGPIVDSIVDEGFGHKRVERSPLVRSKEQAKFAYAEAMLKAR